MHVGRRRRDIRGGLVAAFAAVVFIVACGGDATPTSAEAAPALGLGRPATLAELIGPWRPVPLAVDAAVAADPATSGRGGA